MPGLSCLAFRPCGAAAGYARPAGDGCQCGDIVGDDDVDAEDLVQARQHLMGTAITGDIESDGGFEPLA